MNVAQPGASALNCFGAHILERAAARRQDATWLSAALQSPQTRFIPVFQTHSLLAAELRPLYVEPMTFLAVAGGDAEYVFLAEEEHVAYFAAGIATPAAAARLCEATGGRFQDLRSVASLLPPRDATLQAYARAIIHWHQTHQFCGSCGAPTSSSAGGHLRQCSNTTCGRQHFPRTDPAVIMLVSYEERALLARNPQWPATRFSALAGFVEPGECLEAAVAREVQEEVGLQLRAIRYHSSQPWPFPSSLMLGFTAEATSTALRLDPAEIAEARWFEREELRRLTADGSVSLPSAHSIAFRLVDDWLNARGRP